jgi:hypothetical protein
MPQKSKVALDFVVLLELNVQVQLLKVQKVQCWHCTLVASSLLFNKSFETTQAEESAPNTLDQSCYVYLFSQYTKIPKTQFSTW